MKNKEVMPEFLQQDCTADKLAPAVALLLSNQSARDEQAQQLVEIGAWLGRGQFIPSQKAAETVWKVSVSEGQRKVDERVR